MIKHTNDERHADYDHEEQMLTDSQLLSRSVLRRHESVPGVPGALSIPVATFMFNHDDPQIDRPPPMLGQHNDEILMELGCSRDEITNFRAAKII